MVWMSQIKLWLLAYWTAMLKTVDPQYSFYGLLLAGIYLLIIVVIILIPHTLFGNISIPFTVIPGIILGILISGWSAYQLQMRGYF